MVLAAIMAILLRQDSGFRIGFRDDSGFRDSGFRDSGTGAALMRPGSFVGEPDILVAAYGRWFRLVWSVMGGIAATVIIATAVTDKSAPSSAEPMFTIAATVYVLLAGGFLLTIWRSRISFKDAGILISGPLGASWKAYDDIEAIDRTPDRVDLRFDDGSKTTINRHMADLSQVLSLLAVQAPGR